MKTKEEEEEEEKKKEERRKRFCKILHSEVRSSQDPEHQVENMEVVEILNSISATLDHARKVHEGIDLVPIEDVIDESKIVDMNDSVEYRQARYEEMRDCINKCLDKLNTRERNVLSLRFGLSDNYSRTLEEVGMQFQKTREIIRKIEAKALGKMKNPTKIAMIHKFFTGAEALKDTKK